MSLIVEFKARGGRARRRSRSARDNMAIKMLAEGPRAVVYRATAEPTFAEPAGSTHEFDQIVIALGPAADVARRSTANRRRPPGSAATCSSSDAACRTNRRTPAANRWTSSSSRSSNRRSELLALDAERLRSLHPPSADARRVQSHPSIARFTDSEVTPHQRVRRGPRPGHRARARIESGGGL